MSVDLQPLWRKDRWPLAQIRWHLNRRISRYLGLLNLLGCRLTIFDAFQAPGDALLTGIVCRHVRGRYPRLRLNCLTLNPDLLARDPSLDEVNAPESFFCFHQWYPELVERKDATTNVLQPSFDRLGLRRYEYRAKVYLDPQERERAQERLQGLPRPLISVNMASKESVKTWPIDFWRQLLPGLLQLGTVIQLGDEREPRFEGVTRFAGKLSKRESMAVLSFASLHIGPDSFLMHAANGLDVPSVILFGGSRTPANLGYAANINLWTKIDCGPCWLHDSQGDHCPFEVKCMAMIAPETVLAAARKLML
jgi:hypothetical protein